MNVKILWLVPVVVVAMMLMQVMAGSVPDSEKAAAKEKIKNGAMIVDVRTPEEFAAGHYKKAINIPLQEIDKRLSEFGPTNKAVVVYCRSGNRSGKAKDILRKAGYSDVTNAGGLADMPK